MAGLCDCGNEPPGSLKAICKFNFKEEITWTTTSTPPNVETVRQSVVRSPQRSARKHAVALRLSDATVLVTFKCYKLSYNQALNELAVNAEDIWFQQDGATAHTAGQTINLLHELFPGHIISHRGDIPWPARSPDLAPCDFFLRGHLKAEVYKHRPHTLDELKTAIREEIAAIPPVVTARVTNFRKRLDACIESQGHHMDDVVFHK
ncbi:hypothetical protein ANN_07011 [Periplaneta americana]|uniref:Tc1-like transposase DDE domain-containing protein n=1 Tax=Periplaneta americana TaxID=6978 RepID=A0ABQ8TF73_PERAM|nr:hypothetical protein ANN_07011 [Periplaneta americana]